MASSADIDLARARRALKGAGMDSGVELERAVSNANEAWLGPDFALRVNFRGDLGRLQREAELARRLPEEARYPGVLKYGSDDSIEWLVTRRVEGDVLSRVWPEMSESLRERAIVELAAALKAVHSVDTKGLPSDGDLEPPHVLPIGPLLALLGEVGDAGLIDAHLAAGLDTFVREHWDAFDTKSVGLVHGDPHFENVLWDGEHISALLDLEWSRKSYLECDLETLLSFCDHPFLVVSEDYEDDAYAEDYTEVPGWLEREYPDLFAHPRRVDRLAVLHISRVLTLFEDADTPGDVEPVRVAQLEAVLDGSSFLLR